MKPAEQFPEELGVLNDLKGVLRSHRPTHNTGAADNRLNAAITLVIGRINEVIEAMHEDLPA